jgi:hypothetical protein
MNLTIEAFVRYGLAGSLTFALTPEKLLQAYQTTDELELANVDATITPFAGAGVDMFVGVGFDFGALSAKIGIGGEVMLGNLSLPLYAKAGIGLQPEVDDRDPPADLYGMFTSPQMLFPPTLPQKYRFDAFFKFGANATISEMLTGAIDARLRIKFFWFSKTWSKNVARFNGGFNPLDLGLIGGENDAPFASDFGGMGSVKMPVPLVDVNDLGQTPALPPLPDGGTDAGGDSGPSVSLIVFDQPNAQDPRLVDFSPNRVDQLFYDGYCECQQAGGTCRATVDCCGNNTCVVNDLTHTNKCAACVGETNRGSTGGERCKATSECCQNDPEHRPVVCYPLNATSQPTYCQACRGTHVFRRTGKAPICSACQAQKADCNVGGDCCPVSGVRVFCNTTTHLCDQAPIIN